MDRSELRRVFLDYRRKLVFLEEDIALALDALHHANLKAEVIGLDTELAQIDTTLKYMVLRMQYVTREIYQDIGEFDPETFGLE